jgi:putative intracellular protease/amidase
MTKVGIVIFDRFTDIDAIMHWDLLNRVRLDFGMSEFEVKLLGTESSHISSAGLRIPVSSSIEEIPQLDAVVLASGWGTRSLIEDKNYLAKLRSMLDSDKQLLAAQCSGSLLLGAIGLLNGIKVTAYPPIIKLLETYQAIPVNQSFVVDNNIATASSCLAAPQLSSWLIENLVGLKMAKKVRESSQPIGDYVLSEI